MNVSNSLKQFVEEQGWTDFGIVSIKTLKPLLKKHEVIFEKWLSHHYNAGMEYLIKMKKDRYSPELKLTDVKSVIVLSSLYCGANGGANRGANRGANCGVVARYARGKDYHKVLKKKLLQLSDWLKEQDSSTETYLSVDSGPTVDRVLGEAAGLGFFGKNSNLIDPSRGSFFFIASLMTNLDLPETEKRRMPSCGDCQKCQKACPTGAIVSPGVIDANKCISYLTIENKKGIPVELRSKMGNRLFGCDACQEVCPFNERSAISDQLSADGLLDLTSILSIKSDKKFLEKFGGTSIMRAKRLGLLRNASVVAGNSVDSSLIPYLENIIQRERDEVVREHAKWAIGKIRKRLDKKY